MTHPLPTTGRAQLERELIARRADGNADRVAELERLLETFDSPVRRGVLISARSALCAVHVDARTPAQRRKLADLELLLDER